MPNARALIGDKGYYSDEFRDVLNARKIEAYTPPRSNRTAPRSYSKSLYKQRHKVENMFAKLKDWRRIATRYDRCAQAAALTGLAPIAHDSSALRGKRTIGGGRRSLRHVMFQAALVACYHNPVLKAFAVRLRKAGKPHKVIITAVARKLVTIANALRKSGQMWDHQPV